MDISKNVYFEQELEENRTNKDYLIVQIEGSRAIKKSIKHYNLDAVLSVGYRVKSIKATQFRQWANDILKEYLVEGVVPNAYADFDYGR